MPLIIWGIIGLVSSNQFHLNVCHNTEDLSILLFHCDFKNFFFSQNKFKQFQVEDLLSQRRCLVALVGTNPHFLSLLTVILKLSNTHTKKTKAHRFLTDIDFFFFLRTDYQ